MKTIGTILRVIPQRVEFQQDLPGQSQETVMSQGNGSRLIKRSLMALFAVLLTTNCGPAGERPGVARGSGQGFVGSQGWRYSLHMIESNTPLNDELLDVEIDASGIVWVAGYERATHLEAEASPGDSRGILLGFRKADLDRPVIRRVIDTAGADVIESIALPPGGDLPYFTGRTMGRSAEIPIVCEGGQAPAVSTSCGQFDTLAGWWDREGQLHALQVGSERPQHPKRLAVDAQGNMIIAGYDDTYIPSNYVEAWENASVLSLRREPTGMPAELGVHWSNVASTPSTDWLFGLALPSSHPPDTEPVFYTSGTSKGGVNRGMYVERRSALTGKVMSGVLLSRVGMDFATALHWQPDGNLVVAGATFAQVPGGMNQGGQDAFVSILDPEIRSIRWAAQYGTSASESLSDIAGDWPGHIYGVGRHLGGTEDAPVDGIIVLQFSYPEPAPEVFYLSSSGMEGLNAVAVDGDGTLFVVGYSTGNLGHGSGRGGMDAFIMRLSPPGTSLERDLRPALGELR